MNRLILLILMGVICVSFAYSYESMYNDTFNNANYVAENWSLCLGAITEQPGGYIDGNGRLCQNMTNVSWYDDAFFLHKEVENDQPVSAGDYLITIFWAGARSVANYIQLQEEYMTGGNPETYLKINCYGTCSCNSGTIESNIVRADKGNYSYIYYNDTNMLYVYSTNLTNNNKLLYNGTVTGCNFSSGIWEIGHSDTFLYTHDVRLYKHNPPIAIKSNITPEPYAKFTDSLRFNCTASDADGASTSSYYNIYENGALFASGVSTTENLYNITSSYLQEGDNFTLECTPNSTTILYGVSHEVNGTELNSSVQVIQYGPVIHYGYNITPGFYNGSQSLNTSVWCTDAVFGNITYNITLNGNVLFNGVLPNNTNVSNISTPNNGNNTLYVNCSTPVYNTTATINITVVVYESCLIDERTGNLYDITNATSARLYYDDNHTYFDLVANNSACVNFTSTGSDKLRAEIVLTHVTGDVETVTRYIDTSLLTHQNLRICANIADVPSYEQYILSGTPKIAIMKNLYANCTVGSDYTRFAYQENYLLKAKTIAADYALYTYDDGQVVVLSNIDGSVEAYINLDVLIFQHESSIASLLSDAMAFEQVEDSETIKIYYLNLQGNNDDMLVEITRVGQTGVIYYDNTLDPNEFTIYFDYSALSNVTNETVFKITLTKTDAEGTVTTLDRYFNIKANAGLLSAAFAFVIALAFTVFGLTFATVRTTFSWFGLVIVLISLAILGVSVSAWYITFLMGIDVIVMLYIMLIMNMKNYPTIA